MNKAIVVDQPVTYSEVKKYIDPKIETELRQRFGRKLQEINHTKKRRMIDLRGGW